MREILGTGISFGILAFVLVVVTGLVVQTQTIVQNVTGTSTLLTDVVTYTGQSITTYAQYLPVLALAIVGSIAIGYVVNMLNFGGTRGM